jgi:hypothetical protein
MFVVCCIFLAFLLWLLGGICHYVNSRSCVFKLGRGVNGGLSVGMVPRMQNMSSLSFAGNLHLRR